MNAFNLPLPIRICSKGIFLTLRATHCAARILPWYFVPCRFVTLLHLCALEGVALVAAEDEDLSVLDKFGTLYLVTWYLVYALRLASSGERDSLCIKSTAIIIL